ncbi:MAG: hypothetical protein FWD77_08395 [Betaproteobacteria bacterium]|nr:hypothetical protein [Betaproteobacteria bacterium]
MAARSGVPFPSYYKYESGNVDPSAKALAALSGIGIQLNWLLTGEGEMLRGQKAEGDQQPEADQSWPSGLTRRQTDLMRTSIEAAEEGLDAIDSEMAPADKAELILAIYDLIHKGGADKAGILRIIKLAAKRRA